MLVFIDKINSYHFYIAALMLLFVFWNKKYTSRLLIICVITTVLNLVLKYTIQLPPPSSSEIAVIVDSGKTLSPYGFPSLSVQLATTFWFYLALKVRKRWLSALSVIIVVVISISKLYLGAHFPLDVIGGAVFGGILVWVFINWENKYDK
ncbi:MAG: phosphatase PAP2 family protein [Candidatus Sifarchaeia archaeon]